MCYRRLGTKTCHRTLGTRGCSPSVEPVSQGTPEPWTLCVTSRFGRAWASGNSRRAWVLLLTLPRVSRVAGSSVLQNRYRSLSAALWTLSVTSQSRGLTDFVCHSVGPLPPISGARRRSRGLCVSLHGYDLELFERTPLLELFKRTPSMGLPRSGNSRSLCVFGRAWAEREG